MGDQFAQSPVATRRREIELVRADLGHDGQAHRYGRSVESARIELAEYGDHGLTCSLQDIYTNGRIISLGSRSRQAH
jgi:hypothetical protein